MTIVYTVIRSGNEKLSGKTLAVRRDDRPRERRDRGPEGEAHQLQPVHGHPHHLGSERILTQRPPRASGARVVDEPKRHVHDHEEPERDVEVADREDAFALDWQLVPEEAERIDAEDAVRARR